MTLANAAWKARQQKHSIWLTYSCLLGLVLATMTAFCFWIPISQLGSLQTVSDSQAALLWGGQCDYYTWYTSTSPQAVCTTVNNTDSCTNRAGSPQPGGFLSCNPPNGTYQCFYSCTPLGTFLSDPNGADYIDIEIVNCPTASGPLCTTRNAGQTCFCSSTLTNPSYPCNPPQQLFYEDCGSS